MGIHVVNLLVFKHYFIVDLIAVLDPVSFVNDFIINLHLFALMYQFPIHVAAKNQLARGSDINSMVRRAKSKSCFCEDSFPRIISIYIVFL